MPATVACHSTKSSKVAYRQGVSGASVRRRICLGLPNKSHARQPGGRKVTLTTLRLVHDLQQNEGFGAWRLRSRLKWLGIRLSAATCGRILRLHRQLDGLPKPKRSPPEKQPMPFAAQKRHEYWSADIRYLDTPNYGGGRVYCISILDNYSRAILASAVSPKQDTPAFLRVFFDAVANFGAPKGLVSDRGGVFRAKHAQDIYRRLGITKYQIERGKPWQNYIETHWNVQRRMADYEFAKTTTWDDVYWVHRQWVQDYNAEDHWAHRTRADGRHSPEAVLGKLRLDPYAPDVLHRIFHTTRFHRRVDAQGYVQFRQWRVYGEYGLAGQVAAVWLYADTLTIVFEDTTLAQYRVSYQPDALHLRTVTEPQLFETIYRSAQLELWSLSDDQWLKVLHVPRAPATATCAPWVATSLTTHRRIARMAAPCSTPDSRYCSARRRGAPRCAARSPNRHRLPSHSLDPHRQPTVRTTGRIKHPVVGHRSTIQPIVCRRLQIRTLQHAQSVRRRVRKASIVDRDATVKVAARQFLTDAAM
jgi:transposase InsO family protein